MAASLKAVDAIDCWLVTVSTRRHQLALTFGQSRVGETCSGNVL